MSGDHPINAVATSVTGLAARLKALAPAGSLGRGVRSWLLLLVLGTLVPSLCVGAAAAWLAVASNRQAVEGRLQDNTRTLAVALDQLVREHVSALVTLAEAPGLNQDPLDLPGLRPQANAVARQLSTVVVLRGPASEHRVLFSTRTSASAAASTLETLDPKTSAVPRVFASGRPAVSDLVMLLGGLGPNLGVFVPVQRDNEVRFALGAVLTPERLSALLRLPRQGEKPSDRIIATLTDSQGTIIARSHDLAAVLGSQRPVRSDRFSGPSGFTTGRSIPDDKPTFIAYSQLQAALGWTLWVSQPQSVMDATWQRPALLLGLGTLLALALAALFATLVARRIVGPLTELAKRAEASTAGAGAGPPLAAISPTSVRELERLRVALDGADHAMRRRLTAEQQAGLALSDSESRFRAMADNIPQLAWMARPSGGIFWYNQRWYDYTGTKPEDIRSLSWRHIHHPDHLHRVTKHFRRQTLAGQPWEDTFPLRSATGEWRWFLSRALPIRDAAGQVVLWFGTNTDITAQREAEAALATSEERLRLSIDSTGLSILDGDLDSGMAVGTPNLFTDRGMAVPEGGRTTLATVRARLHPEDRDHVLAANLHAERESGLCHIVHRIIRADTAEIRWVEMFARTRWEADGRRRVVSAHIDVTERVAAEEQRLLLTREVDHRAKNTLAVVQALLVLTPTEGEAARRFAEAMGSRVAAMARAHTLLARERWVGAELRTLVQQELAPYVAERPQSVLLKGPALRLPAALAQPLSLVLHELATNAAKYGALSLPSGRVAVVWSILDEALELRWQETDGPPLVGPPPRTGFGSRLVDRTLRHQLRGTARFEWLPEGLLCVLTLPLPGQGSVPNE